MNAIIKTLSVVLFVSMFSSASVLGEAQSNLLKNPGFESGMNSDVIDAWMGEGDNEFREVTAIYGYNLDEYTFPDGEYALKVYGGGADLYQENLNVQGDTDYFIGGHFYHSSLEDVIDSSTNSLRAFVRIEWFDEFHHFLRDDYTKNHNGTDEANQWVSFSAVFRSPAEAKYATFHIETDIDVGGGSIFVDAVEFGVKK